MSRRPYHRIVKNGGDFRRICGGGRESSDGQVRTGRGEGLMDACQIYWKRGSNGESLTYYHAIPVGIGSGDIWSLRDRWDRVAVADRLGSCQYIGARAVRMICRWRGGAP